MKSSASKISLLFGVLFFLTLVACAPTVRPEVTPNPAASTSDILGIEIVGLHLSSGGYMIDFRYKVVDAAKAAPLIDHALIPYLVHEDSGAKFAVPAPTKVGPMRQMPRQLEVGRQYFIFFANPGKFIKSGDYVTIIHGPHRFEHLKVE
ncbi:MAG: hypothetical protein CVU69_02890 [Deltaproteobacteria bacterium HGW-Deltaproteobacteria-4]|nr:MAG: hypothetical protein CVU69_02890 [Deltaproteobacteria bacterium HGW-Deltaproteobacteria-4]